MEESTKKPGRIRRFILYIIIAFVMILLTSSFVVGEVYNEAGNLKNSPEAIQTVYAYATGIDTLDNLKLLK